MLVFIVFKFDKQINEVFKKRFWPWLKCSTENISYISKYILKRAFRAFYLELYLEMLMKKKNCKFT